MVISYEFLSTTSKCLSRAAPDMTNLFAIMYIVCLKCCWNGQGRIQSSINTLRRHLCNSHHRLKYYLSLFFSCESAYCI